MPNNLDMLWTEGRERVVVDGSFAPNGSSAIVATRTDGTAFRGVGWTAARTGVGTFRITFDGGRKYNQLDYFDCSLQLASGFAQGVQAGAYVAPTGGGAVAGGTDGYIDITTFTRATDLAAAAAADVAANANNRIHFMAVFRKMDVD